MELLDFTRQYTKAALKNAVHDFEKEKKMTSEMAACIRISIFYYSWKAAVEKNVSGSRKREVMERAAFCTGVDADQVYPGFSGEPGSQEKRFLFREL